jgi:hypothetical protein
VMPHAETARTAIGRIDVSDVAIACISYVVVTGNPSHLRYLMRRLRTRLPRDVPVLVGFWPEAEELHDERLRAAVGANYYTSSLNDAVETCMEVVRGTSVGGQSHP